ncbi:Domain of unknown function DUF1995 [Ostreococcus tauri]|uniref:DUF1995 domain-containing protein n=1 Tax=Ostreococcus tauri TaxID=70448 RepID=A0A090M3G3_OSTTA|nr:Domain of unknown function DUF1995 [Ostreococcus tauri]CEF97217.1 Domain of unknown function DUF1995 [Ostreococcus tauri]|eukprot:XP_022838553.1 Domain of unknown function DUF1995 [Ostreococcus tauri]
MRAVTAPAVRARDARKRRASIAREASARASRETETNPPRSKTAAYEQAHLAIVKGLEGTMKRREGGSTKRKSGRTKKTTRARLAVELPVSDGSDEGMVEMAVGTLGDLASDATCVFGSAKACAIASGDEGVRFESVSVDDAWGVVEAGAREGVVALVGVPADRVEAAMKKCKAASGRPVVGVNVEWAHAGDGGLANAMDRQQKGIDDQPMSDVEEFTHSFVVVYSFLPLSIQATMFGSTLEGAVFKCVRGGAPAGSPWRILVKENGEFEQVGAMQRRPEQADLESALYNSIAAKSQVNQVVGKASGFMRGLFNRDK